MSPGPLAAGVPNANPTITVNPAAKIPHKRRSQRAPAEWCSPQRQALHGRAASTALAAWPERAPGWADGRGRDLRLAQRKLGLPWLAVVSRPGRPLGPCLPELGECKMEAGHLTWLPLPSPLHWLIHSSDNYLKDMFSTKQCSRSCGQCPRQTDRHGPSATGSCGLAGPSDKNSSSQGGGVRVEPGRE